VRSGAPLARTLRIRRGLVDGLDVAPDKGDTVVDLDGSFVFPGLINAHDHLELNSQPRLKWRDRYDNASEWLPTSSRVSPPIPPSRSRGRPRSRIACGSAG
jgi:cytosine/adenosine deaminase-related metal-dependent hydrolase